MDLLLLRKQLRKHEGVRLKPYRCSAGKLTIGVGRNLDSKGLSMEEVEFLFTNDLAEVVVDLESLFGSFWHSLGDVRQRVLVDMRFQLGAGGFRRFKRMLWAILAEDWETAAKEGRDSKWWRSDCRNRAETLMRMMESGEDQNEWE